MHSASVRAARIPRESSENRIHCNKCIAMSLFNSHKRRTCSIHTYSQRNKCNKRIQLPRELNASAFLPHTQHTVWVAWIRRYQFFSQKTKCARSSHMHKPHQLCMSSGPQTEAHTTWNDLQTGSNTYTNKRLLKIKMMMPCITGALLRRFHTGCASRAEAAQKLCV